MSTLYELRANWQAEEHVRFRLTNPFRLQELIAVSDKVRGRAGKVANRLIKMDHENRFEHKIKRSICKVLEIEPHWTIEVDEL